MTREIKLTKGQVALVDDEDFEWLNRWKWRAVFCSTYANGGAFRAMRHIYRPSPKCLYMHREIMIHYGLLTDLKMQIDHIDRNPLNNCKSNLRIATVSQNRANTASQNGSFSKFKGVSWYKKTKKWQSRIEKNGKQKHIGYFTSEIEAAIAYDEAARKLFGEFAFLNFSEVELIER